MTSQRRPLSKITHRHVTLVPSEGAEGKPVMHIKIRGRTVGTFNMDALFDPFGNYFDTAY